ncbi:hypothetical protein EZV62_018259 [Acer yangbiense]|uniref:non-specific serine/threonine protein kinase n=1 Tax=Acer yangbiense TaxID=1000413 RepID=A0A5C7HL29_9ROSI|nr:hypothetical protein EZV62_018259 [Acer yangbiense]
MGFQDLWAVVIIIVAGFCFQAQVLKSQNLSCNPDDLAALRDFSSKLEPGIYVWWANSNSSSDCCNWVGITCNSSSSLGLNDTTNDSSSGRVTRLVLDRKRLTGKLSESLGNLVQLRFLNLSHNFLKNSVPESLFHLPNLEVLDLSFNDLSGPIPQTINLPSIQHLDISSNLLNGSLPTRICENSTRIRVIRLAVNYISGDFSPGLGNCVFLEHLCLGMNDLTGNIAEDIFQLPKLNLLGLQDNKFSGQLSSSISLLSSLVRLDVSTNNFSGRIPDVFSNLNHFKDLVAHSNKFVGKIPTSLSNSPTVNLINLRNNSLDGSLELNCSAMTNLTSLHLGTNRFNGSLPSNLSSCRQLKNIDLARNNFSGQVPETFRNFHSLSYLSLSNCSIINLSSALQILQECKNLTTLVLTKNFPNEELPADPSLHFENLKVLVIASCRLKGLIPQWLRGCTKLQLLDLSWNHLVATIPAWIGQFQDLFYLDLSNNTFTGQIPKSITGLASLINRSISLEEPSSDFPFFMKRNESARGLQYNQIWSFPPTVELGHNLLTGPIWPEFGNLKKLHVLDLKFNNLSGTIPTELSGMTSLEMLDLSHNDLTGNIPPSLVKLSFLSRFSVAHNQLLGKIPWEGQFATFPNSSFEDNKLCGDHRFPCQSDQVPVRSPGKPRRNKYIIAGMVVGIVFGIAFLVVLMFMILSRACSRGGEVDPEKEEADINDKDLGELRSRLVVLFQNNENNKELSIDDLLKSTDNFDQENIIGCGGFGLVYKATLPDGKKVAIKRLSGDCGQMEREFRAEVEALSRAQHPNLVHLQGYCMHKSDRLLIYSYMENGSLDYWLHERFDGPSSLDWVTRLRIAQGAARGLAYLHQSCEPHILHRDIKSSNILLNENFDAQLADFGLARLILPYDTHVTTDLVGTLGYIPPEYGQSSVATYKGDVYSFGVVLLELLTGKRPIDMCKPKGSRDLISWVIRMKKENRESEVLDPFIYDKQHDKEMLQVLEIACLCLSNSPKVRPTTQQLVSSLDNIDTNI